MESLLESLVTIAGNSPELAQAVNCDMPSRLRAATQDRYSTAIARVRRTTFRLGKKTT